MTGYRIAAIPTQYGGRQYRSRLEARWAAFFDVMGWRHEYEPFGLGTWSPDFLLGDSLLVEVKPITEFDRDVAAKMQAAAEARKMHEMQLLLVGVSPSRHYEFLRLGWTAEYRFATELAPAGWRWSVCPLAWAADDDRPIWRPNAYAVEPGTSPAWMAPLVSPNDGPQHQGSVKHYVDHALALWAQATNAVQWKPPA